MSIDGPSSPLPPSSGLPQSALSSPHTRSLNTSTRATRTITADPLALGENTNGGGSQAEEDGARARPGRRGARNQINENVPQVKDATGEKVMESFEIFLNTYVRSYYSPNMCSLVQVYG